MQNSDTTRGRRGAGRRTASDNDACRTMRRFAIQLDDPGHASSTRSGSPLADGGIGHGGMRAALLPRSISGAHASQCVECGRVGIDGAEHGVLQLLAANGDAVQRLVLRLESFFRVRQHGHHRRERRGRGGGQRRY